MLQGKKRAVRIRMNNVLEQDALSSSLPSRDTHQCANGQHSKSEKRSQIGTARVRLLPLGQTQRLRQSNQAQRLWQSGQAQRLRQARQVQWQWQARRLYAGWYRQFPSHRHRLLHLSTWITVTASLAAGIVLLWSDVFSTTLVHAPVSAAPLLLIGSTYLGFLALLRPKLPDLFKALIVSAAFFLWGIDQLLPSGWFATTLGDVVIVLYVVDLGWMIADRLKEQWKRRHRQ